MPGLSPVYIISENHILSLGWVCVHFALGRNFMVLTQLNGKDHACLRSQKWLELEEFF